MTEDVDEDRDFVDEEFDAAEHTEITTTEKIHAIDKILSQDGKDLALLHRYTRLPGKESEAADIAYAIAEQFFVNKMINALIKGQRLKMEWFDEYYRDVERLLISIGGRGREDVKEILGAMPTFVGQKGSRNLVAQLFGMEEKKKGAKEK